MILSRRNGKRNKVLAVIICEINDNNTITSAFTILFVLCNSINFSCYSVLPDRNNNQLIINKRAITTTRIAVIKTSYI